MKIRSGAQSSSDESSKKAGKSSSRELGNWLKAYSEYTDDTESPENFHLWSALSILASAVRKNLVLDQGTYLVYPSMYVILIGPPGRVAKSTAIRMGRRILLGVENIFFGPDSITKEELIRQMAKIGMGEKQAAMTIHSSEFSSLIDPSGVMMISFLIEIYDGDIAYRYATKGQGRDNIQNPVLNILGATTPSWIATGLPIEVLEHGFIARIIFVYADRPKKLVPFPTRPNPELVRKLTNDLDHISRLEGEFIWGEGAKDLYRKYYHTLDKTMPTDYRLGGFHSRKKVHMLKVAMLLSIAESDELVIRTVDIEIAWELLVSVEKDMARAFSAVGRHSGASDIEIILERITHAGGMSSEKIHDEFFAMGDIRTIGQHISMLIAMNKVVRQKDQAGNVIYSPVKSAEQSVSEESLPTHSENADPQ